MALSPKALIREIGALSREGVQQGDPAGPAGFCMTLKKCAEWDHKELCKVSGMALFDMDDGYLMGPLRDVMEVVGQFQVRLKKEVGAILNPSNCEMWGVDREQILNYLCENSDCLFKLAQIKLRNDRTTVTTYGVMWGVSISRLPGVPICLELLVNCTEGEAARVPTKY